MYMFKIEYEWKFQYFLKISSWDMYTLFGFELLNAGNWGLLVLKAPIMTFWQSHKDTFLSAFILVSQNSFKGEEQKIV